MYIVYHNLVFTSMPIEFFHNLSRLSSRIQVTENSRPKFLNSRLYCCHSWRISRSSGTPGMESNVAIFFSYALWASSRSCAKYARISGLAARIFSLISAVMFLAFPTQIRPSRKSVMLYCSTIALISFLSMEFLLNRNTLSGLLIYLYQMMNIYSKCVHQKIFFILPKMLDEHLFLWYYTNRGYVLHR